MTTPTAGPPRALLLENVHPTAAARSWPAGFEVEPVDRRPRG